MKTAIKIFICLIGLWGGLSGCSFSETIYKELADIEDKRLGILKGSLEEQQLATAYPQASVKVYDKTMGLFMDIEAGRCDVALLDEEVAIRVISRNSDYACLGIWEPLMEESWYVIVPKSKMDKEVWETVFIGICWPTMLGNLSWEDFIPRLSSFSLEPYWLFCWLHC